MKKKREVDGEELAIKLVVEAVQQMFKRGDVDRIAEKLKNYEDMAINGGIGAERGWRITPYGRSGYVPNYHLRYYADGDEWTGKYGMEVHDKKLAVLTCAMLNAFEIATGRVLVKEMER